MSVVETYPMNPRGELCASASSRASSRTQRHIEETDLGQQSAGQSAEAGEVRGGESEGDAEGEGGNEAEDR